MPSIYLRGSAFESSEGNETYLLVNGESRGMTKNRGLNTVVLKPDGTQKAQTSHDVFGDINLWNAWADWVNVNAQTGDIVTVASFDAVNNAPSGGTAEGLLKSVGAQTAFNVTRGTDWRMARSPYVLLFVKGHPRALEASQPHTGPNAHLSVQFAAIYQHNDYSGAGQALSAGQYNLNDILIGNDQLSSIRVPEGLQVILYQHADMQGNTRTYTADAPSVGDFNDQASSILVEQVATIYQHSDYQGQSKTLKPGHYNMADLGIGNDQLSSLKVPPGLKVTLFQHANFSGETRSYNANVAFTQDFNDNTSSIIVEQGPAPILTPQPPAPAPPPPPPPAPPPTPSVTTTTGQAIETGKWYHLTTQFLGANRPLEMRPGEGNELFIASTKLNDPAQMWQITALGDDFYRLTNKLAGDQKSLDIRNDDQKPPVMAITGGYTGQYWKFNPLGNNVYRLTTSWLGDGKAIDVSNDGIYPLVLADSAGYTGQFWQVTLVPEPADIAATASGFTGVGSSLGNGYESNPPTELPSQPLSELIAGGALPQYDLLQKLESQVQNGVLTLDKTLLGEYGTIADLAGSILNVLTPIRNVTLEFVKTKPGTVSGPSEDVDDNPNSSGAPATPENHALRISGDVTLFTTEAAQLKYAEFFYYKGKPNASFKFVLADDLGIGTFLPGVPLIQALKISEPTLMVVTSAEVYDEELEAGVNQGFNFFGEMAIAESEDDAIKFIGGLLGVDKLGIHAAVDISGTTPEYILEAELERDITILDGENFKLSFTKTEIGIAIKGKPPEPSVSLANELTLLLMDDGEETEIAFIGGIKVEAESITGSFTMDATKTGEWREPFGIPGVIIRQMAVQVGFTYIPPWIDNVGVHGDLKIGDVDGSISILVDSNDPDNFVLAGSTDRITIIQLMSAMSPVTFIAYHALPGSLRTTLNNVIDVALEEVKVNIVPSATAIGAIEFRDEGVTVMGRLVAWGWKASAYINVDASTGITARADMDPIDILGVLKITGAGTDPAPILRLRVGPTEIPYVYISARIEFLALVQELQIQADETGVLFVLTRSLGNILTTNLTIAYKDYNFNASGSINFNLNASINTIFGRITLVDIGFNANATIRAGRDAGFFAQFSGGFRFYGKDVSFPTLTLNVPPGDFQAIYNSVIQQIEAQALDIFNDVFQTLEEWANAVKDGVIIAGTAVTSVAKDVYNASAEAAATAYRTLSKGATEAAQGISTAYNITANEVAKALQGADYAAHEVANAMEDAFDLTAEGAAYALKYAGYGVNEIGNALSSAYNVTADAAATALRFAGYGINEVGGALSSAYNVSADGLATALRGAGYAVNEVGSFLKDVGGFADNTVNAALNGAGYAVSEVGNFMGQVFGGGWIPYVDFPYVDIPYIDYIDIY